MGSIGQIQCYVVYPIKQQHGSKFFARRSPLPPPPHPPPLTSTLRIKRSKFNFSEHGLVAYQTNGKHRCSNMVATILPAELPLTIGVGSMSNSTFSEHGHFAYRIKGIACRPPPPVPRGQKVKIQLFQICITN